ncbi:hypothetical protein ACNOYE_16540 [Nannocystaceae bacterium ST9]
MSKREANTHWRWQCPAMLVLALGSSEAAAQSPEAGPDEAACQAKASGDACTLVNGRAGTCGPGTCSRLDYSQGSPPKASEEPCTVCVAGSSPQGPALGEASGADEGRTVAEPGSEPSDTEASEKTDEPPKTKSRCSVMDRSAPSDLGWLGLLALGLVVQRRSRRARQHEKP